MKRVNFQMIADNRFCDDIKREINNLKSRTNNSIKSLGLEYKTYDHELIDFGDGTKQYRVEYWVEKKQGVTYNQIYKAINSVQAVPYKIM